MYVWRVSSCIYVNVFRFLDEKLIWKNYFFISIMDKILSIWSACECLWWTLVVFYRKFLSKHKVYRVNEVVLDIFDTRSELCYIYVCYFIQRIEWNPFKHCSHLWYVYMCICVYFNKLFKILFINGLRNGLYTVFSFTQELIWWLANRTAFTAIHV